MSERRLGRLLLEKPCCADETFDVDEGDPRVALIGNPNVGKSTLFNVLTGARQHVGNWPGKTVSIAEGTWRPQCRVAAGAAALVASPSPALDAAAGGSAAEVPHTCPHAAAKAAPATTAVAERTAAAPEITLIDLPGTYSLQPGSPDEALTRDVLVDHGMAGRPDVVVVTADGSNLARNLFLLAQVMETGVPLVVALTMLDVAESRGIKVDAGRLSEVIGAPVVPVQPRRGKGTDALAEAVLDLLARPHPPAVPEFERHLESAIGELIERLPADLLSRYPARWLALTLLSGEPVADVPETTAATARALAGRLFAQDAGETGTAGATGATGATGTTAETGEPRDPEVPDDLDDLDDPETLIAEQRYAWAHRVISVAVSRRGDGKVTWSDRADRVLTSRWFGPPAFLAVMWGVFTATTKVAAPLQGWLGGFFDGPVRDGGAWLLGAVGADGGALSGLVLDGVISRVGQLLSFVPLMAIMFVLLSVLEDSGYLARAAFVVDRLMRLIGLPGRAFLPLIVGFGCNVPALAGTRILGDRRHRLLTGLLIPFISCSARLTVYVLLASVFFGSNAGTVVFAMYVLSVALVIGVGFLLRKTMFRGMANEPLVLDLPPYHLPTLRVIGAQTWQKLKAFLKTASGIIVATVTLVWLLSSIPLGGNGSFGDTPIEHSVFGATSRVISPAFAPAGFDDWHASAALLTGFVAKEAVVSTVAQTYSMGEPGDTRQPGELGTALKRTFDRTSHGHPIPAVLAFMVFLLAYTPCMTTVAAQRVELGGRVTLFGIGMQLTVAWLLAVVTFQIGSVFW